MIGRPNVMVLLLITIVMAFTFLIYIKPEIHYQWVEQGDSNQMTRTVINLRSFDEFYEYGRKEKFECKQWEEIGGAGMNNDGSKYVCFDERFNFTPGKCTVLSFGINNEWSFDDTMDKKGCTVYAFDPSMNKENFSRSARIHFFNIGLSDYDGVWSRQDAKPWKMRRYETIINMLNLKDTKIDYLKMDIEGSEIQFFEDVFQTSPQLIKNIRQIGMEIHPRLPSGQLNETRFPKLWKGMQQLEYSGFKLAHYERNRVKHNHIIYKSHNESQCYEIVWLKEY